MNPSRTKSLVAAGLLAGSIVAATPAMANAADFSTSCEAGAYNAWSTNFYQTDAGEWRIDVYGERDTSGFNHAEVDYWRVDITDGAGWIMRRVYLQGDGIDSRRVTDRTLGILSPVGDGVTDTIRVKTKFRITNARDKSCIYERPFRR